MKKMYSCFQAITKFTIMKIFMMKILIKYYKNFHVKGLFIWR